MLPRLPDLAPYLVLGLALALVLIDPAPVQQVRAVVFDNYQRLDPRPSDAAASPVVIVDLDEASLARHGQWPWPRTLMAAMVDRLRAAGAAAIGLDVLFAEPDRTSPENVLAYWPDAPEVEALRRMDLPSNDAVFAEAIARAPVVTAFAPSEDGGALPVEPGAYAVVGDDPRAVLRPYPGAVVTLPSLARAAAGHGAIIFEPDRDSVVRSVPLVVRVRDQLYFSLAVEALRVAAGAKSVTFKAAGAQGESAFAGERAYVAARIGPFVAPTDRAGRLIVRYAGHDPARFVPAWRVLAGEVDPARFEGRIVLVGTSAKGLSDLRSTPLDPVVPGVEVHAEMIEQIVAGAFLERPDWARGLETVYLLVLGVVLIALVRRVGAPWSAVVGATVIAGAIALSWFAFAELGWLLDPVYPSLGAVAVFLAATVVVYLRSEAERREVRMAFSRYLSPELVERLAAHPERLRLGGEMRDMTLLFCDIRGFTTISEQFEAQELTAFINRFLTPMTDVILRHRGTIDKYMGDAVMAFWNAPLDDPDHAEHACRAALEMVDALDGLNGRWQRDAEAEGRAFHRVAIGIGLNTGECCVGNLGSEQRFDYSVIGDDVNLASRLEGLTKTYGVGIVAGENTAARIPGFAFLELGSTRVKGRTAPVRVFALAGDETTARDPAFAELRRRHAAMLEAFRLQRTDDLPRLIDACRAVAPPRLAGCYAHYDGLHEALVS